MKINISKKIGNWGLYPFIKVNEFEPKTLNEFKEAVSVVPKLVARGNRR